MDAKDMNPVHDILSAHEVYLQSLTQRALACIGVSDGLIGQSRLLLHEARQAQARTHVLGVQYADWRLRMDLLEQERALTRYIG